MPLMMVSECDCILADRHVSPEHVPKDKPSLYDALLVHKLNHPYLVWYSRHLRINIPTSEEHFIHPFYTWSTLWPGCMRKLGATLPAVEAHASRQLRSAAFARVLRRLSMVSFWHQASCSFQNRSPLKLKICTLWL